MATAAEAAQDQTRVLDALTRVRLLVEALDRADGLREVVPDKRSGIRTAIEIAEKAAERVHEFLADQVVTPPLNPRDGGPL